jgi:hypothetical protein
VLIAPIKDEQVFMACYLIVRKVMWNYTRNECTLDVIIVAEFSKNGAPLNWCKYLLTKMLQACADAHDKAGYFIYNICW